MKLIPSVSALTRDVERRIAHDAAKFVDSSYFRVDADRDFPPRPSRRMRRQVGRQIIEIPIVHDADDAWRKHVNDEAETDCGEENLRVRRVTERDDWVKVIRGAYLRRGSWVF